MTLDVAYDWIKEVRVEEFGGSGELKHDHTHVSKFLLSVYYTFFHECNANKFVAVELSPDPWSY